MKFLFLFLMLMLVLSSCSIRPVLLPNRKYIRDGVAKAELEIDYCFALYDQYVQRRGEITFGSEPKELQISRYSSIAVAAGDSAILKEDSALAFKQKHVDYCLERKGYRVIAWD